MSPTWVWCTAHSSGGRARCQSSLTELVLADLRWTGSSELILEFVSIFRLAMAAANKMRINHRKYHNVNKRRMCTLSEMEIQYEN